MSTPSQASAGEPKPFVLMTAQQFKRMDNLTDGELGRSMKRLEREVAKTEPFADWFTPTK